MTFEAGQIFDHAGMRYRVIAGNRCDGDLIIEFSTDGTRWYRPKISHAQILISFKFQVEENNYGANGKVKRGRGGWYLLDSIKRACLDGWQSEAEKTAAERAALSQASMFVQSQMSLPM